MYIKKICDINVGPIEFAKIDLPFHAAGNPKPIIIVRENGTGKSLLISNIVDAFYEIAATYFINAREGRGESGTYYKTIHASQIKQSKDFLLSFVEFGNACRGQAKLSCYKEILTPVYSL